MGNTYVLTCIKEEEVDEPLWSTNDQSDEAYISGWIKTTRNVMYKTIVYEIENIEEWVRRHRIAKPEVAIINWYKKSNYS